MISFFRRWLSSWIFLGILGLVLVAFIITGADPMGNMSGGSGGGAPIAKVGGSKISSTELLKRIQNQLENARRQQPGINQKEFIAAGAFEGVTNALISARALEAWAHDEGLAVGKRLVDAQIAKMPAFQSQLTGQFDDAVMRNALAQARISEKELRTDIANDTMRGQVLTPIAATAAPPSAALARPYTTLLLEERTGSVGIIPFAALIDPRTPSDAEIATAYKANIATYTRPEARVLRYALFGPAQVAAASAPTEAEIAQYYRENATTYAAKETRSLSQVITPNEALARSVAAQAKGGAPLAAVAAKAGLEAVVLAGKSRADFAVATSDAIAGQVFAAAKGGVIGPVKGTFGWYIIRVDTITGTAGRPLAQVRPEIIATLARQKGADALSDLGGKIEDAIADGASFAEIAANNRLAIVETPAILADGQAIDRPDWKAPPEVGALLKTGFEVEADERPTVETITKDQLFAVLGVARVIPPTPLPLARVRDAVARDIIVKRAAERAQAIAQRVTAAVNRGIPLAKALAESGANLPPPQPARATQFSLAQAQAAGRPVAPAVRALFELKKGKAKQVPGERGQVLFVTVLESIVPGDIAKAPGLVEGTRMELARAISSELGQQFQRAVEKDVKVERYPAALATAKRQFAGEQ